MFLIKNIENYRKKCILSQIFKKHLTFHIQNDILVYVVNVLVAQLDRVTGYEPVGRGFESLQAR